MDYVTRQFIVLTKKLRKEFRAALDTLHNDFTRLTDRLDNFKDAVDAHWKADEKSQKANHPVTVTDLRTQIPIRVQTEAHRSKIETAWRVIKGALETAGIIAAVTYAWVAYKTNGRKQSTRLIFRPDKLSCLAKPLMRPVNNLDSNSDPT